MSLDASAPSQSGFSSARKLRDFALLLIGTTAIGTSSIFVRLAETDPAATGFWRMVFALPIFLIWSRIEQKPLSPGLDGKALAAAILAGAAFGLDLVLSNIALGLTSMTSFIILVHLAPVVVVIVAWFWFREKPTPGLILALGQALVGAVLLVQSGRSTALARNALLGDLASIGAAVGYAGFILATRRARMGASTGRVSLISACFCALFCLVASFLLGESLWPRSNQGWLMLAGMGLLCHAFGQGISAYAVSSLGASVTSIVLVYGVAVTIAGGWLFFNEVPNLLQAIGGALVLAAVVLCRPK